MAKSLPHKVYPGNNEVGDAQTMDEQHTLGTENLGSRSERRDDENQGLREDGTAKALTADIWVETPLFDGIPGMNPLTPDASRHSSFFAFSSNTASPYNLDSAIPIDDTAAAESVASVPNILSTPHNPSRHSAHLGHFSTRYQFSRREVYLDAQDSDLQVHTRDITVANINTSIVSFETGRLSLYQRQRKTFVTALQPWVLKKFYISSSSTKFYLVKSRLPTRLHSLLARLMQWHP